LLCWLVLSFDIAGWLGLPQTTITTSPWQIAKSVIIFLGVPLLAGYLSRRLGERVKGRDCTRDLPSPDWALGVVWLLFTIVILFSLQGNQITSRPWDVARIALPLLAYFASCGSGATCWALPCIWGTRGPPPWPSPRPATNFELAIAVAIATYGATSGQALAGVVGPLIEVPVLVGLVSVSLALRRRFGLHDTTAVAGSLGRGIPEHANLEDRGRRSACDTRVGRDGRRHRTWWPCAAAQHHIINH